MPTFGLESLLWLGLPMVGVPILIHLINLMRHRRVEWAAMEFLLESQKRNSRWIIIKQLLLLLLRMAAVAAVVLLLAQTQLKNELGQMLGSGRLHHIVLFDDSLSMSDQIGDTTAFDSGKKMVRRLADEAASQPLTQAFTLVPFSKAERRKAPLLDQTPVNKERFKTQIDEALRSLEPTQLATRPLGTLEEVVHRLPEQESERRVFYIVSDFRAGDWEEPGDLAKLLTELNAQHAQIRLVDCVESLQPNLSIVELEPMGGTRAAGVPIEMKVSVKNFGDVPARGISVTTKVDGREEKLLFDNIAPKEVETRRFEVRLPIAGEHEISAKIDKSDALDADNERFLIQDVPADVPVLIIDSDVDARDAYFLAHALDPEGTTKTGIAPQIEMPDFLDDNPLDKYRAIYLLNANNLEPEWINKLEAYVTAGGGLGVFVGKEFSGRLVTEKLYKDGKGLFPLPLIGSTELLVDELEKTPDLQVGDDPIFRVFSGEKNSFVGTVTILRYWEVDRDVKPPADSRVQILAKLRNGAPFAASQPFGDGRVVAILTTASPDWNDWGRNPSFPIVVQQMQSFLSSNYVGNEAKLVNTVGVPIQEEVDVAKYGDKARFRRPLLAGESEAPVATIDMPQDGNLRTLKVNDTEMAGVYNVQLTLANGKAELHRYARNISSSESNLAQLNEDQLRKSLKGVDFSYDHAGKFSFGSEMQGFNLTDLLIALLIMILIGEQILAYFVSYHPQASGASSTEPRRSLRQRKQQASDEEMLAAAGVGDNGVLASSNGSNGQGAAR